MRFGRGQPPKQCTLAVKSEIHTAGWDRCHGYKAPVQKNVLNMGLPFFRKKLRWKFGMIENHYIRATKAIDQQTECLGGRSEVVIGCREVFVIVRMAAGAALSKHLPLFHVSKYGFSV